MPGSGAPVSRGAYRLSGVGPGVQAAAWNRPVWWVLLIGAVCTDLVAQALNVAIVGPAGFLLLWMGVFLAYPRVTYDAIVSSSLPWLFPAVALCSAFWSQAPIQSFKIGLEICITVAAAMLMARRVPARDLILVVLIVTLIGGIASLVVGTRRDALIGVYGSKNSLGFYAALLLISATAILLDRRQRLFVRLAAALGFMLAPILLIQGNSAGALIGAVLAIGMFLLFFVISVIPPRLRSAYLFSCALVGGGAIVFLGAIILNDKAAVFDLLGKQENLTGRALLWQRAAELMELKPWLGYGLSSFWIQGSVEAEGLWRLMKIASRSGFHFHNLYYQTAIELGFVGVAALYMTMLVTAFATFRWAVRRPGVESGFFVAFLTFIYTRTVSEVEIGGPFVIQCMVFTAAWVYATQYENLAVKWYPPRPGYNVARRYNKPGGRSGLTA